MAKAEEGGNQTMRTLLIGGTKHGEYINLPEGQTEWELVESNLLAGLGYSGNDPRYIGNVYALDPTLTSVFASQHDTKYHQVFTHACLREPENGGRYPQLLRAETEAHEKYKRLYEAATDSLDSYRAENEDLEDRLEEVTDERDDFQTRLTEARKDLEVAARSLTNIQDSLNIEYGSAFS